MDFCEIGKVNSEHEKFAMQVLESDKNGCCDTMELEQVTPECRGI